MTDTGTLAWLDQADAWIAETIRSHGWAIQYVGGEACSVPGCDCRYASETPFAYTVGLFGMGHPELLIFGVPPATAAMVLNTLGERVHDGANLVPGQLITYAGWPRIVVEDVPNPGEIVFSANRHFRRPPEQSVPVLQLSYEDGNGRFPWEHGFALPETQPRPGTFRARRGPSPSEPD